MTVGLIRQPREFVLDGWKAWRRSDCGDAGFDWWRRNDAHLSFEPGAMLRHVNGRRHQHIVIAIDLSYKVENRGYIVLPVERLGALFNLLLFFVEFRICLLVDGEVFFKLCVNMEKAIPEPCFSGQANAAEAVKPEFSGRWLQ